MKKLALLSLTFGCRSHLPALADLDPATEAEGRALIAASVAAHGGLEAWAALGDLRCDWHDAWVKESMTPAFPGDSDTAVFRANFHLNKGLFVFPTNPEQRWGYDSVEGWTSTAGVRTYDQQQDATFMVPTTAYFLGLPFKFMDAGLVVRALGEEPREGGAVKRVFITFEADRPVDSYVAELDAATGMLRAIDFTVVDVASFIEGRAEYPAWQEVNGAKIPAKVVDLGLRPLSGELHTTTFSGCQPDPSFDRQQYEKPA